MSFFFRFVASVSGDTLQSDASANISDKKVGAPIANNPYILLACLARTDLLTGVVVQPIAIVVKLKRILGVPPFDAVEKLFIVSFSLISYTSITQKCGTY